MLMSHSLEAVKQFFVDNGCQLLEDEYINSSTKMNYRCKCQKIFEITFKYFNDKHLRYYPDIYIKSENIHTKLL